MPIPRIQRAFLAWLGEAQQRLAREVLIQRRTRWAVEFVFDVGAPFLHGWLNGFEITVAVTIEGECWDLIYDSLALPTPVPGGFVCEVCEPEDRAVFRSRESLWRDHLFEPFGAWINDRLAVSKGLGLLGEKDGWTAATLIWPGMREKGPHRVLPLAPSPPPPARRPRRRRGATADALRIPIQAGHLFRDDVGHRSDLKPAAIPR